MVLAGGREETRKSNDLVIPCQYEKKLWIQEFQISEVADHDQNLK